MKPIRRCNHAGCREYVPFNETYCKKHVPKRKIYHSDTYAERIKRDGKYIKFYKSKQWENTSRIYRLNHPLCEDCLEEEIIKKVDVVDHKIEIKDDWSKRLDRNNLRSLCHFHHNRKTRREQIRREKEATRNQ